MVVKVAVGSLNPVKIRACERAFRKFYQDVRVTPVKPRSGAVEMPYDFEVYEGARRRAWESLEITGTDYGVGVEAGYVDILGRKLLTACCVVLDRGGNEGVAYSLAFQPPEGLRPSRELGQGGRDCGSLDRWEDY